jgi:serine/threonine protein phosphatase 1
MVLSGGSLFRGGKTAGPRGYRAYAVGDIHGRLDLLDDMLRMIEEDIRRRRKCRNILVFLGDLIDRGPQSAQVVERLSRYRPDFAKTVFLMGNHEEVMLRVLAGDTGLLGDWLKFGGVECVRSYGIDPQALLASNASDALAALKDAVPQEHVDFIRGFADTLSFGSYLFVHAGIRPGVPLAEQAQKDLRWIRNPFLDDTRDHGFIVVHGHTITRQVDECSNRIGVDTGAYRSGLLTALAIEGPRRWFLQTGDAIGAAAEVDRGPERSSAPVEASRTLA